MNRVKIVLSYMGRVGVFSQNQYAFDGKEWWRRTHTFSRTGNPRKPGPWLHIDPDFAVKLAQAINPDDPPRKVDIDGLVLFKGLP